MKVDPKSRVGGLLIGLAGHILRWLLRAIGSTLRLEVVAGAEHLRSLQAEPTPMILCFWHERTFLSAHFLYHHLHRRGLDITLLASQSRDGEMVTRMVKSWGIETVRGSATRGGLQALRAIHRAVKRWGTSPIMTPDGPKGPLHYFKPGVVVLAQTTGVPILPLGFAAKRVWRLRSWDRLIVPWPFTRVSVVIGDPQEVADRLTADQLEGERQRLERVLQTVTEQAEAAVAGSDR